MEKIKQYSIPVNRTARFYTLGEAGPHVKEILFVLHGYGQLASYFIRHFEAIDDGSRFIVAPEALSRFYVARDPERIGASWMTRSDRENEIQDYLAYLNQLAAQVLDLVGGRKKPITVLGFSQGAATASRWVTLGRLPAQRLILWAGAFAHDIDLEVHGPTLSELNPLFVVGDKDQYISPELLAREKERFETNNISYTFVPFEGEHKMNTTVLKSLFTKKISS